MDESSGFELSLLEGMDEALLVRLHDLGIRTRAELESRIGSREGRRALAGEVGVSPRRLQVIHHLNFLLPEERVDRTLEIERRLLDRSDHVDHEFRQVWRVITGVAIAVLASLFLAVVLTRSPGPSSRDHEMADRVAELEERVKALAPLGVNLADHRIVNGIQELGPAPGWSGSLSWSSEKHREILALLGSEPDHLPRRAVSLALLRLAELEHAPLDSLSPLDRAREAADLAREFPLVDTPATLWDDAAVLVRTRIRSRALGLASLEEASPDVDAAARWGWTSPGYLTAEELMIRLEGLPVDEEVLNLWSESLVQLRQVADASRDHLQPRPEAYARDYWIRRGELELAVVAAVLGKPDLLPYNRRPPREFIRNRQGYLDRVRTGVPAAAATPLNWLAVEYAEALSLLEWLESRPPGRPRDAEFWIEMMNRIEDMRLREGMSPGPSVEGAVQEALNGDSQPWVHPRAAREAGLRPLLMESRAAVRRERSGRERR